jgi:hypothetical protein
VLVFEKGGALVEAPQAGDYLIAMKPNVRFAGDRESSLKTLAAAFPGCTFAWKSAPPPEPKKQKAPAPAPAKPK